MGLEDLLWPSHLAGCLEAHSLKCSSQLGDFRFLAGDVQTGGGRHWLLWALLLQTGW